MNIQEWFDKPGTYKEGLKLYANLPNKSNLFLRSIQFETNYNLLKLKYELKKALNINSNTTIQLSEKVVTEPKKEVENQCVKQSSINESVAISFKKETMAMYPMELHTTYRERISNFYRACELKFQLNKLNPDSETEALQLILELEVLWEKIDRAWFILNHWKYNNRIMPFETTEDFSVLNGIQLVKKRDQLQTSISKRKKTLEKQLKEVEVSPEDKSKLNLYNRKNEQLQQLVIDLETIRNLLKDE